MKRIFTSAIITLSIVLSSTICASAISGNWTSPMSQDFNGVSQVGTTSNSLGALYVVLEVLTSNHSTVGKKITTVGLGMTVEHTCWGQPLLWRYGKVITNANHNPWFNE